MNYRTVYGYTCFWPFEIVRIHFYRVTHLLKDERLVNNIHFQLKLVYYNHEITSNSAFKDKKIIGKLVLNCKYYLKYLNAKYYYLLKYTLHG